MQQTKSEFELGSPIQLSVPNIVRLPAYLIGLLLKGSCLYLVVEFKKGKMKISYRVTSSDLSCCSVHQLVSVNESWHLTLVDVSKDCVIISYWFLMKRLRIILVLTGISKRPYIVHISMSFKWHPRFTHGKVTIRACVVNFIFYIGKAGDMNSVKDYSDISERTVIHTGGKCRTGKSKDKRKNWKCKEVDETEEKEEL